jgi:uncharacterized protein
MVICRYSGKIIKNIVQNKILNNLRYGIENKKYNSLITLLKKLGKAAIAFSGGVDSTFLLAAAKNAIGDNVVGITVDSPALPRYELDDSIKISRLRVRHIIIKDS